MARSRTGSFAAGRMLGVPSALRRLAVRHGVRLVIESHEKGWILEELFFHVAGHPERVRAFCEEWNALLRRLRDEKD